MKGSITIEGAIVVPSVLICILVLIYLVFYMHDESVAKALAHQYIQTYATMEDDSGYSYIYDNPIQMTGEMEQYKGAYLLGDASDVVVTIHALNRVIYKEVKVTVKLPVNIPFIDVCIYVEEKHYATSGCEVIRLIESINDFF